MRRIKTQILILILAAFIFFPFLIKAGEVDISVSATIWSSSTLPAEFCGDGVCKTGETCSNCSYDCGSCVGDGSGGPIVIPEDNKIIFRGKAYPLAIMTILKNDAIISVFKAQETGIFEREINGLAGGTYNFSVFAEDSDGRESVAVGFSVGVLNGKTTTISGIFIPPTIDLDPFQTEKGRPVLIFGQAFPESSLSIFISPDEMVKKTDSTARGKWSYELDTNLFTEGEYLVRAKAALEEGEQSSFSQSIVFLVKKSACRGADLNFDGKVDLVDFSILLYFWGQKNPGNRCADINSDGTVNIIDFSIMMYYWTD